jgi:hypothetical protein
MTPVSTRPTIIVDATDAEHILDGDPEGPVVRPYRSISVCIALGRVLPLMAPAFGPVVHPLNQVMLSFELEKRKSRKKNE